MMGNATLTTLHWPSKCSTRLEGTRGNEQNVQAYAKLANRPVAMLFLSICRKEHLQSNPMQHGRMAPTPPMASAGAGMRANAPCSGGRGELLLMPPHHSIVQGCECLRDAAGVEKHDGGTTQLEPTLHAVVSDVAAMREDPADRAQGLQRKPRGMTQLGPNACTTTMVGSR